MTSRSKLFLWAYVLMFTASAAHAAPVNTAQATPTVPPGPYLVSPIAFPRISIEPVAINNRYQVAGTAQFAGKRHACLWQPGDGDLRDLGVLPGDVSSEAVAINDQGQVIGDSLSAGGQIHAFLWQNYTMREIGGAVPGESWAAAINDNGHILLVKRTGTPERWHLYLLVSGKMRDTGVSNPTVARLTATDGIVGYGSTSSTTNGEAFTWSDGKIGRLGVSSGRGVFAAGINRRGDIAGHIQASDGVPPHAFFQRASMRTNLSPLMGDRASEAVAVNDAGQVVGNSGGFAYEAPAAPETHAVLWQNGKVYNLYDLLPCQSGWMHLDEAIGITDSGVIIGTGTYGLPLMGFMRTGFYMIPTQLAIPNRRPSKRQAAPQMP